MAPRAPPSGTPPLRADSDLIGISMHRSFLSRWNDTGTLDREQRAGFRNEIRITYGAIAVTLISITAFAVEGGASLIELIDKAESAMIAEMLVGNSLIGYFLLSGLIYHVLRWGYLRRFATHRGTPASLLERVYRGDSPSLAILVPSYKEEVRVVRQTLISAALQQSPNRRVVLLIDDAPAPRDRGDAARLAATRRLPQQVGDLFAIPSRRFEQALAEFAERRENGSLNPRREIRRLAILLREAAHWLDRLAAETTVHDHNDALFVERILEEPARSHRARAVALLATAPEDVDLLLEYRRLAALFKVEFASFERKRYANLSHEPNKAMNLNGYLALMGKSFREVGPAGRRVLQPTDAARATLAIPDAEFVVVLDADSLILAEYSLRLLHFITRPGNERVAVVQTPYASVPGAASTIERVAGATTDVQLMAHQGATLFGAGSWVGASALVRRAALEDIAATIEERGHSVCVYVRDRTLNEDTDTTVDLIRKGWTVHNYPERLAYSATPPDFGALLIQRRRWATGGLIILPNVFRYFCDRPSLPRLWECLIRAQYILSAPVGSIAIVALMFYPFDLAWSAWPMLAFLAMLLTFQRDLMHNGNRARDLLRAMALNAMLLPINLAGAINSIEQLWSRRKIPFQRTPKVRGRTATTPVHVFAQVGFMLLASVQLALRPGFGVECLFFAFYAAAFAYALHAFIGWQAAMEDALGGLAPRLRSLSGPLSKRAALLKMAIRR